MSTSLITILDYLRNKFKILSSGLGDLYDITGCKASCTMPQFSASVQEHYIAHEETESEVKIAERLKRWSKS